ncbi:TRAP transporter small permease subunit [Thalassospira sp. SM2505]
MNFYGKVAGTVFGIVMIFLSITITAETLLRKFLAFSLGGVDELSGYAVAICAPLAFTVALIHNAHIRINILQNRLPVAGQAIVNLVASVMMSVLAIYLVYFSIRTVIDTATYNSIAQTPWATPLIYPQSIWVFSMAMFALATIALSIRAARLLLKRDWQGLVCHFGPETVQSELVSELNDLQQRMQREKV